MVFHGTTRTVPYGSFDKYAEWWQNHLFLSPTKTLVDLLNVIFCSMRKGWGFKRLEELSGRKQKLASLLKMINDLRKIKRIGKSQSWVSSLMILKEDNFGISYRNLSHSHRPQFYLFVYLFIYFWKGYSHIDNLLTRSSISSLPLCQKRRRPATGRNQ